MRRRIFLIAAAALAAVLLVGTATAVMTVCTECYMVTLPWEPGPQGMCLDLQPDGWSFCFDGSPGKWCLHSNDECYDDEPTEIPDL
jgi:hypothetical protein